MDPDPVTASPRQASWPLVPAVHDLRIAGHVLGHGLALRAGHGAAHGWVIVSWPIIAFSGYRIWRIDHPGESAQSAVGVRVRLLASVLTTALVAALFAVLARDPMWLVAGIVVVWLLVLAAVGLIRSRLARPDPDGPARPPDPS